MHPAIIVCIILAVIGLIISIFFGMDEGDFGAFLAMFGVLDILVVGCFGFGVICGMPNWSTTYTNIPAKDVESYVLQNNGIVVMAYKGDLYHSKDISYLNAINNIDYYVLKRSYNAYGGENEETLYPVEKGKIHDYIEQK